MATPCFARTAAADGPYRLIDEDGVIHITDAPTDPRYRAIQGFSGTAAGWLRVPNGTQLTSAFSREIRETAERYGVSAALVEAVIRMESAFNPWAVSAKGAQGLMQLMPRTASALGVRDSFNPRQNIEGGVRHLRYLLDRYPGNLSLALAAYNAGEGAVDYYGGIPPFTETRQYVQKVLERTGNGNTSVEPPPPAIYRYEDADGCMTFTNIPPISRSKGR
ncbi:MAG TPA: lytic transglycosylase domain-containing protein [Candidatus Methylomirabilis sp.]|nr:lytic transglycosylase domain-containing protein [Candidatus Methylomirabilis sp.]